MQPLGRKHFKNQSAKTHVKWGYHAWWEDLIEPSKKRHRQASKREIKEEIDRLVA